MRRTALAVPLGLALTLATPASPSAAYAASYLDEAVQGLQSSTAYVSPLSTQVDSGAEARLEEQIGSADIGVAVLPPEAAREAGGDPVQFLRQVIEATGRDTVVVAFGNDLVGGSRVLPGADLAEQAERANSSTEDALLEFVEEVRAYQPEQNTPPAGEDSGGGANLLVYGVVIAVILVLGILALRAFLGRKRDLALPKLTSVEGELRNELEKMRQLAAQIGGDYDLRSRTLAASTETDELFAEIRRLLPDQIQQKSSEFNTHVRRVNKVLTIYLKAQNKPRSVPDAPAVMAATRRSIVAYNDNVHRNLLRVGQAEMIDFEVDVALLTQSSTFRPELNS